MSKLDDLAKMMVDIIEKRNSKRPRALDTVGTVSRVDDDYVWVKFAGSEEETPVKETIKAKKGDIVQVRASNGSAWIVGNETSPPSDDTLAQEAYNNSDKASRTAQRASDTTVVGDTMYYLASDQDEGVTTEDEGWTVEPQELSEEYPYLWAYHDYERGNGKHFKSTPVIIAMYAEDGVGVDMIQPQYALSTSSTTNTGTWSTSLAYLSGYYIWTRDKITFTDGTVKYTTAIYDAALTDACSLSYDTAQYFWTKSSGGTTSVPTGSYITEVPKSTYQNNPSGGAVLLRSAGMYIRYAAQAVAEFLSSGIKLYEYGDSTYPLAQFLSSGAIIGKTNGLYYMQLSANNGVEFYHNGTKMGNIKVVSGELIITGRKDYTYIEIGSDWANFIDTNRTSGYANITANGISARDTLSCTNNLICGGTAFAQNIHELMTAQVSEVVSLSTQNTYYKLKMAQNKKVGDNLSISSNGIKCAKTGFVLVSGQAQFQSMTDHHVCNIQMRLYDPYTDTTTNVAQSTSRSAGNTAEITVTPRLVEITHANSIVYMYVANTSGTGGTAGGTAGDDPTAADKLKNYLTVQYV